jgi:hypothetical protein
MANIPNYDARQKRQQERADFRAETKSKQANLTAKTGEIRNDLIITTYTGDFKGQLDALNKANQLIPEADLATGLERVVGIVSKAVIKIKKGVSRVFYGNGKPKPPDAIFQNPLDMGLVKILNLIAGIDFCAIFSFAANQIPDNLQKFDPKKAPPRSAGSLEKKKYQIQKLAYDVQGYIDKFMALYAGATTVSSFLSNNPETQKALKDLIAQVTSILEDLNDVNSSASLVDAEFSQAFPQAAISSNFITNAIGSLNKKIDLRTFTDVDFTTTIDTMNKVRSVCIVIQAYNDPKTVLQQLNTLTKGKINDAIKQLDKILDPKRAVPFVRSIIKTAKSIVKIMANILKYITLLQFVIRLGLLFIKIFGKLSNFFKFGIQIPQIGNTISGQVSIDFVVNDVIHAKGLVYFLKRVLQINEILGLIRSVVSYVLNNVIFIIPKLELIARNLNSCDSCDEDLKAELNQTIQELKEGADALQKYMDDYFDAVNNKNKTYGDFTIEIITEETTDIALSIKRRFGIALDGKKNKVVQSTPTYASDDTIIINEVKLLLSAGGYINKSLTGMSSSDMAILIEGAANLGDPGITLDDIDFTYILDNGLDLPDNENEEVGLGLNAFVNNLPGGKKLRKRTRKMMAASTKNLAKDLKSTDPSGKYTNSIVTKKNAEANKLEIANLKDDIKDWQKEIALASVTAGPVGAAVIIKDRRAKIKEAQNKINELER